MSLRLWRLKLQAGVFEGVLGHHHPSMAEAWHSSTEVMPHASVVSYHHP